MVSQSKTVRSRGAGVALSHVGLVLLVGSCLVAGGAAGQDVTESRPSTLRHRGLVAEAGAEGERAAIARSIKPKVKGNLPAMMWGKLVLGSRAAVRKIRAMPGCSALFASRGADGVEVLAQATFAEAATERDQATCARGAGALTDVAGSRIRLCPRFAMLSPSSAALILIHEALHGAGMSEKPLDPGALTSAEINRLVESGCGQ